MLDRNGGMKRICYENIEMWSIQWKERKERF